MVVFDVTTTSVVSNAKRNLTLYRLVYQGRLGTMAVLLLCLSFFVQGADMARANEELPETPVEVNEVASEVVAEDSPPELEMTDEVVIEESSPEEVFDVVTEEFADEDLNTIEEVSDEALDEVTVETSSDSGDEVQTEESVEDEDIEVEPELELADDEDDIYISNAEATSSELVAVAYSDDSFSFNKAECTELASGSFYCQKPNENTLEDALFSAPDVDGDLEIFLVRDGVQAQVSFNQTDDAAPFYDQNSDSIVWHRLINDRYQIVSYDVESQEETVLTDTAENNMEPNRQGQYTVWQRWIDGGWNIILHDGKNEKQITKTTSHNVAPYIHGTLVVWNQHDQVNERTIEMYDLLTATYVSIEDPEGMSVSNPRMVFVYDSIHPNGDIVTKGYDMLARKFIDLDTLPRNLPEELPESDSTGETRALIQNKPSGKSEIEELIPAEPVATSTPETVSTSTVPALVETASTSTMVLDLSGAEPVVVEPEVAPAEDLIIEPLVPEVELLPEVEEVVEFVMPE